MLLASDVPRVDQAGWRPRLAPELFTVPLEEDRILLYAPLQRSALIANRQAVGALQQYGAAPFEKAHDPIIVLLRDLGMVDPAYQVVPPSVPAGDPEPIQVTLLLTTACNLRCAYCYASAGENPPQYMRIETACRGIRFAIGNCLKRGIGAVEVTFHGGGEPTLNWTVLAGAAAYAQEETSRAGIGLRLSLATNGVLTDEQIDWALANLSGVSLSFDGLPEVHDANRRTVHGGGTSERVMHTMRRLDDAGFSYGIRMTVLAHQVERLEKSVDFICTRFHPRVVQVEPVYLLGRGREERSAESREFVAAFRNARLGWPVLMFSGARVDAVTAHFCAATQEGFCLSASGHVTTCVEVFDEGARFASRFFVGRSAPGGAGYEFDAGRLAFLRSCAVGGREHCQACFARWNCGGDCLHKVLEMQEGPELQGAGRCHVIREITKDLILEKIAQSGGIAWKGGGGPEPRFVTCGE
jgi:uncharacterized protein